jgi:hypothetical protein
MIPIPDGEWQLECSADIFERLRGDSEFALLVTIARVVNAVKFGTQAHRDASQDDTPVSERQRVGSLLYLSAVVHEILELKKTVEKRFAHIPAVGAVFELFNDERIDARLVDDLKRIRNRGAFHFDVAVATQDLPKFPAEPFTFVASTGRDPMSSNYELADIVTFGFLFEAPANVPKLTARLSEFRPQLDALLLAFVKAADRYLFRSLVELGFVVVPRSPGSFAAERREEGESSPPAI